MRIPNRGERARSTSVASSRAKSGASSDKRAGVQIAIWTLAATVLVGLLTVAVPIVWEEIFKSHPKLRGTIVLSSMGENANGLGSIVVYLHLQSLRDVPVVPVEYRLYLKSGGEWVNAPVRNDLHAKVPMYFSTAVAQETVGKAGDWTVCLPAEANLTSTARLSQAIAKDKPVSGFIQFTTVLGAAKLSRRQDMKLIVIGADQTEYEIDEPPRRAQQGVPLMAKLVHAAELHPGDATCE